MFAVQVAPALAAALGPELAACRAGLASAQLLGLGVTRYLLRLPAVTALTRDEIEDGLTPAIKAILEPTWNGVAAADRLAVATCATWATSVAIPDRVPTAGYAARPGRLPPQPTLSEARVLPQCRGSVVRTPPGVRSTDSGRGSRSTGRGQGHSHDLCCSFVRLP
ncbi:TetR/AcrR family transcriptional regulator [Streptomyces avermitilis]|uniref:TetR/AcrR family transcriptional regulator n=1 Tax=Streptomyces avermitilis TaxID=33903 RepID=UPI003688398A